MLHSFGDVESNQTALLYFSVLKRDNQFNFSFGRTCLYKDNSLHSLRHKCPVSSLSASRDRGRNLRRMRAAILCLSVTKGGEKGLLSNHLSGFDVTKDIGAQLKAHYFVSKSTPISHVTSNK